MLYSLEFFVWPWSINRILNLVCAILIRIRLSAESSKLFLVSFGGLLIWSNIHIATAITCACLPTYRPILEKLIGHGSRKQSIETFVEHGTRKHFGDESDDRSDEPSSIRVETTIEIFWSCVAAFLDTSSQHRRKGVRILDNTGKILWNPDSFVSRLTSIYYSTFFLIRTCLSDHHGILFINILIFDYNKASTGSGTLDIFLLFLMVDPWPWSVSNGRKTPFSLR